MRIKRTSWHYRWLCEWEGHEIHYMTACEYVGKFLLSIVASTLAVVAIIALALLAVGGLYLIGQSMFAAAAEWITPGRFQWEDSKTIGLGVVVWATPALIVTVTAAIGWVGPYLSNAWRNRQPSCDYIDFED